MPTDIFRPVKFGKETFHAQSFDEDSFVMHYLLEAGGGVGTHYHKHMNEYFLITQGEVKFKVAGQTIIKKEGEELTVPKGVVHSISNVSGQQIGMDVKYFPCADTHRMFQVIAALDEEKPGSAVNLLKYFYIADKLGLKEFSTIHPAAIMSIIKTGVALTGKLSGWGKLVERFRMEFEETE